MQSFILLLFEPWKEDPMGQDNEDDLLDTQEAHETAEWLSQDEFSHVSGFSNRVASWFDWTRPNIITTVGAALCLPALYFLLQSDLQSSIIGAVIIANCLLCDWLDGALARYQDKKYRLTKLSFEDERRIPIWQRFLLRGSTNLGAALDPFADKVKYYVVLFTRGWDYVSNALIIISFITAIVLTLVRPIKRYFKIGDAKANIAGKIKIFAEIAVMLVIIFLPHLIPFLISDGKTAITTSKVISNIFLIIAMIFGFLSLSAHIFLAVYANMKTKRIAKRLAREAAATQKKAHSSLRVTK